MTVNKWDIFLVDLGVNIGSEQNHVRPVVIISDDIFNDVLHVVNILPITSLKQNRKIYSNETIIEAENFGLDKTSIVMAHQIKTIDKSRLIKVIGKIDKLDYQEKITQAICLQLGIKLK